MCHLMCPLASILAEPSLLSDLLRVLRYAVLSGDIVTAKEPDTQSEHMLERPRTEGAMGLGCIL